MTYDEICAKIKVSDLNILEEKEIQNGKQLKIDNSSIINCYANGNHNIQGKNIDKTKEVLESSISRNTKKIFVVYGHDDTAKIQLEAILRRWELEPIILDQLASNGQTIIEKLEEYSKDIGYAIVIATPDDDGKSKKSNEYMSRARQNVVLELGMFLAKLGREKVAILLKQAKDFEKPSDIHGLIYIPFKDNIEEASLNLIRELTKQGYSIKSDKI